MRQLYLQIYATFLASLLVFAVLAGLIWRYGLDDSGPPARAEVTAALAEVPLPPPGASRRELVVGLNELRHRLHVEATLFEPDGRPIAFAGRPIPFPVQPFDPAGRRPPGGPRTPMVALPDGRLLIVRRPPASEFVYFAFVGALLAVGIGFYPLARRLTRRIEALKAAVEAFGAGDLSRRAAVSGRDEVAELSRSFNHTAERVASLLAAHKTLLANASHELRSPLARLRMGIELLRAEANPALRAELERNIAEVDTLIDEILTASRMDALDGLGDRRPVDLLTVVAEECAESGATIEGEPATIVGDARLLRRLVRNLLDNARRHGDRTTVEASLRRAGDGALVLAVSDRGRGVAESERERIFEPFYRQAGTREDDGGVGLGLALVRQIARRHGGDVRCLARPGGGSIFEVMLGGGAERDGQPAPGR